MKILKLRKILKIKGALLEQKQLENYLEKIASEHVLQKKSSRDTYPIYRLEENFEYITKVYERLNQDLKEKITIHPAGEWLLDNYYMIEEVYRMIRKELSLKKYLHYTGIKKGLYRGFARIYVVAAEIVGYSEGKISSENLTRLLQAYQTKKTLTMEEIWNVSLFLNIVLIEKIRAVCEQIYYSQIQKYKVESILERLVEQVDIHHQKFKKDIDAMKIGEDTTKETFVEYLSYRLRRYGKKGSPYIAILEEQLEKAGTNITEMIRKEHFNVALQKVMIGNCIKSIKEIQRINFTEIFEEINGVENILKKDPAGVYEIMDHKTKDHYRNIIKQLSKKTNIAELYITKQASIIIGSKK